MSHKVSSGHTFDAPNRTASSFSRATTCAKDLDSDRVGTESELEQWCEAITGGIGHVAHIDNREATALQRLKGSTWAICNIGQCRELVSLCSLGLGGSCCEFQVCRLPTLHRKNGFLKRSWA